MMACSWFLFKRRNSVQPLSRECSEPEEEDVAEAESHQAVQENPHVNVQEAEVALEGGAVGGEEADDTNNGNQEAVQNDYVVAIPQQVMMPAGVVGPAAVIHAPPHPPAHHQPESDAQLRTRLEKAYADHRRVSEYLRREQLQEQRLRREIHTTRVRLETENERTLTVKKMLKKAAPKSIKAQEMYLKEPTNLTVSALREKLAETTTSDEAQRLYAILRRLADQAVVIHNEVRLQHEEVNSKYGVILGIKTQEPPANSNDETETEVTETPENEIKVSKDKAMRDSSRPVHIIVRDRVAGAFVSLKRRTDC